jgi:hypothetical protein
VEGRVRLEEEREDGFALARAFHASVAPTATAIALGELERDLRTVDDLDRLLAVSVAL